MDDKSSLYYCQENSMERCLKPPGINLREFLPFFMQLYKNRKIQHRMTFISSFLPRQSQLINIKINKIQRELIENTIHIIVISS